LTMVVHLISPDNRYDMTYLRNYALLNVKARLERIAGVGQVQLWGAGGYAMRIWLDPNKLAERDLTATGVIGGSPSSADVPLQLSVNGRGRLQTTEQFGAIVIKTAPDGGVTYLRD